MGWMNCDDSSGSANRGESGFSRMSQRNGAGGRSFLGNRDLLSSLKKTAQVQDPGPAPGALPFAFARGSWSWSLLGRGV